jgi:carbonic anhydrase
MVELNVEIQCGNLSNLDFVKEATESKQFPHIHGWVLDLSSGLIKNLNVNDYS